MATKPIQSKLGETEISKNGANIMNAIRASAPAPYQASVPLADPNDVSTLRFIGSNILADKYLREEFLGIMASRIFAVHVASKSYENPWAWWAKKGVVDYGEVLEDTFIKMASVFEFGSTEDTAFMKQQKPDVLVNFFCMNYQKTYKITASYQMLKSAFLSYQGLYDFIQRVTEQLLTACNYDEFLTMKYMIAMKLKNGLLNTVSVGDNTDPKTIAETVQYVSGRFAYMNSNWNEAGVTTYTNPDEQILIVSEKYKANLNVNVLGFAYNENRIQYPGTIVNVDSFGALDIPRLNELFKKDPTYYEFSADELKELDKVPSVLVSRDWFMIYDNLFEYTEAFNPEKLYWNHWLNKWSTFAISNYQQAAAFTLQDPVVNSVTITPNEASVAVGNTLQLAVNVDVENFASKRVTWLTDSDYATVTDKGLVKILQGASGQITITARSVLDPTKEGTCTITVA